KGAMRGKVESAAVKYTDSGKSVTTLIGVKGTNSPQELTEVQALGKDLAEERIAKEETKVGVGVIRSAQEQLAEFHALETQPVSTLKSIAGAAKQTVKSLIPGSDVYDEIKVAGGGSAVAGLRLMTSYVAHTAKLAGGAISSAAGEVGAALTAEVSAGAAATAAVTGAAVV